MGDYCCEFGFLQEKVDFASGSIDVSPVRDFEDKLQGLRRQVVFDFIHCPIYEKASVDLATGELNKVLGSEYGSDMLQMPASHRLIIRGCTEEDAKRGSAGFLVHLLSFIYRTRLQFSDWWIDGKVPFKPKTGTDFSIPTCDVPVFVETAYEKWNSLASDEMRTAFTNALYFNGKMLSSNWEWEQFLFAYIVFDALWFATGLKLKYNNVGHAARMEKAAREFHLHADEEGRLDKRPLKRFKEIVCLRNSLFHQCTWAEGMPGEASSTSSAVYAARDLRKFNKFLIVSFITGSNAYASYPWAIEGEPFLVFDKQKREWRVAG